MDKVDVPEWLRLRRERLERESAEEGAVSRRRGSGAPPVVLSVDWDFFLWRGAEAKDEDAYLEVLAAAVEKAEEAFRREWFPNDAVGGDPRRPLDGGAARRVYALQLFDWGHDEFWNPALLEFVWRARREAFERLGLDPRVVAGYRGLAPVAFLEAVLARFDVSRAPLLYADSHCRGFEALRHARPGARVVHFDAHHDCGYVAEALEREAEAGVADCGSWLHHAARVGLVDDLEVVYPEWRGPEQAPPVAPPASRFSRTTWAEWSEREAPLVKARVDAVFLARSGSWTPPWFDGDFLNFMLSWPADRCECVDCAEGAVPGRDACQAREV